MRALKLEYQKAHRKPHGLAQCRLREVDMVKSKEHVNPAHALNRTILITSMIPQGRPEAPLPEILNGCPLTVTLGRRDIAELDHRWCARAPLKRGEGLWHLLLEPKWLRAFSWNLIRVTVKI